MFHSWDEVLLWNYCLQFEEKNVFGYFDQTYLWLISFLYIVSESLVFAYYVQPLFFTTHQLQV